MKKTTKPTFCLLGCGWLGFPFLKRIHKTNLYSHLKISSRSLNSDISSWVEKYSKKRDSNIEYFSLELPYTDNLEYFLKDCQTLLIAIPPKVKNIEDIPLFNKKIDVLIKKIKQSKTIKEIFFISSTSVYPNNNGKKVCEDSINNILEEKINKPKKLSGIALLGSEKKFLESFKNTKKIFILRLAGLIGISPLGNRSIKKIYSPKTEILNHRVNLIPIKDCIKILNLLIEKRKKIDSGIYNICHDDHPTRKEIITKLNPNLKQIKWIEDKEYKIVDNSKIKRLVNYQFSNLLEISQV